MTKKLTGRSLMYGRESQKKISRTRMGKPIMQKTPTSVLARRSFPRRTKTKRDEGRKTSTRFTPLLLIIRGSLNISEDTKRIIAPISVMSMTSGYLRFEGLHLSEAAKLSRVATAKGAKPKRSMLRMVSVSAGIGRRTQTMAKI